ncbi:MAG: UDP-N-acetylmuramate:L-alanyl-gamma-D-glutamyl-meso-diaminopimelate ligase, partial [Gammaproteobacteria bacterium]
DSAFFDKRSKFVHYRPRTLILNNLEFDHADIFDDLAAIQRQFHHLLRTVPGDGLVVHHQGDPNLAATLRMGCWTQCESFALDNRQAHWSANILSADGSQFELLHAADVVPAVRWGQIGLHNVANALAAVAAAHHVGVAPPVAAAALSEFSGVKRRLEVRGHVHGITIYDDFAHHPTAIRATLEGLRARVGTARIVAVLEPRSNTMRAGVHNNELGDALDAADHIVLYEPGDLAWSARDVLKPLGGKAAVCESVDAMVRHLGGKLESGDHALIMSNGSFGGLHDKLVKVLQSG